MRIKLKAKQNSTIGYTKDQIYYGVLTQDILKLVNDNEITQRYRHERDWINSFDILD